MSLGFRDESSRFLTQGGSVRRGVSSCGIRQPLNSRCAAGGGFTCHLHRVGTFLVRHKQNQTSQTVVFTRIPTSEEQFRITIFVRIHHFGAPVSMTKAFAVESTLCGEPVLSITFLK